jgi:error-prone DNA polymerase
MHRAGLKSAADLENMAHGAKVEIAGLVLVRQRPGSAKGVIFMTLEDETGTTNAIVWPKVFETYRPVVMGARLVALRGRLQKAHGVIHVVADHLVDASARLGLLLEDLKTFDTLAHADEVRRPAIDPRQAKREKQARTMPTKPAPALPVAAPPPGHPRRSAMADLMPKGRNFH